MKKVLFIMLLFISLCWAETKTLEYHMNESEIKEFYKILENQVSINPKTLDKKETGFSIYLYKSTNTILIESPYDKTTNYFLILETAEDKFVVEVNKIIKIEKEFKE